MNVNTIAEALTSDETQLLVLVQPVSLNMNITKTHMLLLLQRNLSELILVTSFMALQEIVVSLVQVDSQVPRASDLEQPVFIPRRLPISTVIQ